MRATPSYSESSHTPDFPANCRNLLKALIATTALSGVACTPMREPVTAGRLAPSPTFPQRTYSPTPPPAPLKSAKPVQPPVNEIVVPITVTGEAPNQPWPEVPSNCAYTGVVLSHDQRSVPHRVRLENLCINENSATESLYQGRHLWINSDAPGRFPLPFHGVHLEEAGNRLILAFTLDGKRVEEPLTPGYLPGTQTFEQCFEKYVLPPIRR